MGFFSYIVALATTLAIFTEAIPTEKRATAGHFTIQQTALYSNKNRWPPKDLWTVLRKHHRPLPPEYKAAVSRIAIYENKKDGGSVKVTPSDYDAEFVNEITVGNDTVLVDIDTGSADFWVFSSQLPERSRRNHRIYHPDLTGTKLQKHTWELKYGDGTGAAGNVFQDKVSLPGLEVSSQAVQAATWVSYEFADQQTTDGILGFGFDKRNQVLPKKQRTWFDNIKQSLSKPIFTACLKHQAPGFYDFGFIDQDKHVGTPTYLPVDSSKGWWETTFNGFATGDIDNSTHSFKAIVDTGTTFMLLPKKITEQYYSTVPATAYDRKSGGWTFPCNTTLPDFAIHINEYKAVVPGEHIKYAPLPGTNTCFGSLQSLVSPPAILGGAFLKSQFVIFDHDGPRMGFAAQKK
ncbi:aspergillopepsin A [Arthroderma uncinatum]|uniref:aspergillopepsin A n=1 Tax=Arthroderma uncinatum TaxID=74035 RepID=UPI00144A96BD|nr:aspergillopepsin A [Arthroderma uncinatum]KAF3482470.1 aspergillopepsin A [Arthroderma uncinatum]